MSKAQQTLEEASSAEQSTSETDGTVEWSQFVMHENDQRPGKRGVYVGRGPKGVNMHDDLEINEPGWLGNPYELEKDGDRDEVIAKFEKDFVEKLKADPAFAGAVAGLAGRRLACWCQHEDEHAPRCHAEVIAKWAHRLAQMVDE